MGNYYPYWSYEQGHKHKNPLFDNYSNQILNLKHHSDSAIKYFYEILKPLSNRNTLLAVAPSHDPQIPDSGVRDVAKLLCKNGLWLDATDCLKRKTKISKLTSGGSRIIQVHLDSIKVENPNIIKGRDIFLLDDVKTTGNTLIACRMLLERAGAKSVKTYALGETYLNQSRQMSR